MEALCPYYWVKGRGGEKKKMGVEKEEPKAKDLVGTLELATQSLHSESDKLVVGKLALALSDGKLYGRALLCFLAVFRELADLWPKASIRDSRVASFSPYAQTLILSRIPQFVKDVEFYLGSRWKDVAHEVDQQREIQQYMEHLGTLADENPLQLVPYMYHLGLALLAGGQAIKKMTWKAFGRDSHSSSVHVFTFPNVESRTKLKRNLKEAMNAIQFHSEEERQAFIRESSECFQLNNKVVAAFGNWVGLLHFLCLVSSLLQSFGFNLIIAVLFILLPCLYYYQNPSSRLLQL